jgi:hypothetical protein
VRARQPICKEVALLLENLNCASWRDPKRPRQVEVYDCGWTNDDIVGGDSGGPVFSGESAYGTISCGDASTLIYSAVDFVESGIGVTVLTSP